MSLDKIIEFPASTSFNPEQAMDSMKRMEPTDVLIIGYCDSGCGDGRSKLVHRSSRMTRAEALFLLENAKAWVLNWDV